MHEFAITASKMGWLPSDIADLAKDQKKMELFLGVLLDTHIISPKEYIVRLDADPVFPEGSELISNNKIGEIRWDSNQAILLQEKKQNDKTEVTGFDVCKKYESNKKLANLQLCEYLLKNQNLIPRSWRWSNIFFLGTVFYVNWNGKWYVPFISSDSQGKWGRQDWSLDRPFCGDENDGDFKILCLP